VYNGIEWIWVNYPVKISRWCLARLQDRAWTIQSPRLILRPGRAELHITQEKEISAKKVKERKLDPDLVTIGVNLNIKNLAVITVRPRSTILKTLFVTDKGLDHHRYRHLKRISKRQSGKPVQGERNCGHLWDHIKRTNRDVAHKTARVIADLCALYPGSVLLTCSYLGGTGTGWTDTRRLEHRIP
jgi:transposase